MTSNRLRAVPAALAALALVLGLAGCGWTARDAYLKKRSVVFVAESQSGMAIAQADTGP